MSTHPFEFLPPVPDDLWPKVSSTTASHQSLLSDALPASLKDVAGIVGRAVHLEMQSSGEYAVKTALPPADMRPHEAHLRAVELRFHSRLHAEAAARLLRFYESIRTGMERQGLVNLPSPGQLKEAATRTYQVAVRDETALQNQILALKESNPGFNDELYGQLKKKVPGHGLKLHR